LLAEELVWESQHEEEGDGTIINRREGDGDRGATVIEGKGDLKEEEGDDTVTPGHVSLIESVDEDSHIVQESSTKADERDSCIVS
jgi:hypothetical protein